MIDFAKPQPAPLASTPPRSAARTVALARWFALLMGLVGCAPAWADYEIYKRQIAAMNLPADEYEHACAEIAAALGL